VYNAARRSAFQLVTGDALDRVRAPVGAHVGEDLGGVGEQVTQKHRHAVKAVIFRGNDEWSADAVPVKGTVEDGFEEVAVGLVIRPLPLALETRSDGVVAVGLFAKAHLGELGIADHHVAGDEGHLDRGFPFAVEMFAGAGG